MQSLLGNVAIVTGGGSGIGRSTALAFAKEGAKVVVADVRLDSANETANQIREAGGEATAKCVDVTDACQVQEMVEVALEEYGRVDCAFNNAGIGGQMTPVARCTEANWDSVMATNLKGVWLCMKYEIRRMLEQGKGSIVNTAAVGGLVAFEHHAAYVASKHGVIGLTRAAALDYARAGIRINAVCPGMILTPALETIPGAGERLAPLQPMGRVGSSDEISDAVVWLCSERSSFVTGHAVVVDGGLLAQGSQGWRDMLTR